MRKVILEEPITSPKGAAKGMARPIIEETDETPTGEVQWHLYTYFNTPSSRAFMARFPVVEIPKPKTVEEENAIIAKAKGDNDKRVFEERHRADYAVYETGNLPDFGYKSPGYRDTREIVRG